MNNPALLAVSENPQHHKRRAKRRKLLVVCVALIALAGSWWALEEGRPWLDGIEAYVYGFPLVMMDLTKEVSTAVPSAGEVTAAVNQFSVMSHYPDASFRAVARTGLDTLFACAWADLEKEPLVLSVPDKGLRRAMDAFVILEKGVKKLKTDNGWIVMPKDMGNYGTDYTTRAGIALVGLGAIQPHDVVYPTAFIDADGNPLDAANRYILHFEKGQTPPTNATWSVSMYDPQGFYVPDPINRYNLAAWMPLKYNSDGSLDFYIQASRPGADKESNWLPAPASGPFNLTVRDYWPTESVLDGTWKMPAVKIAP